MDVFVKFNRNSIDDRKIDTLIGLSKGLTADGVVNIHEAKALHAWLIQSKTCSDHPIIANLLNRVDEMLSDDHLDDDESQELLSVLNQISGNHAEVGEMAKATTLPLCNPIPTINFAESTFLFTGTFAFGKRAHCKDAIQSVGGLNAKGVTKALNYLVIGTYVTDSWKHESFGNKIKKAVEYREQGVPLAIISEEHWIASGGFEV